MSASSRIIRAFHKISHQVKFIQNEKKSETQLKHPMKNFAIRNVITIIKGAFIVSIINTEEGMSMKLKKEDDMLTGPKETADNFNAIAHTHTRPL